VRSAKAVKITDASLLKRLGILCGFVGVALLVRTLVAPPVVIVGRTADNLKAFLCKTDWWDHTFTSSERARFPFQDLLKANKFNLKIPIFSVHSGSTVPGLGCAFVHHGPESTVRI
jgi:hypothetical protein